MLCSSISGGTVDELFRIRLAETWEFDLIVVYIAKIAEISHAEYRWAHLMKVRVTSSQAAIACQVVVEWHGWELNVATIHATFSKWHCGG